MRAMAANRSGATRCSTNKWRSNAVWNPRCGRIWRRCNKTTLARVARRWTMTRQKTQNTTEAIDLGQLIEKLGPLNNQWRDGSQAEKALALWEMGEALLKSVSDPTDKLLWDIQGRSYLTRVTLSYALIVRRCWKTRGEL